MFLLVPAYPGCPGSKAVKRSLLFGIGNDMRITGTVPIVSAQFRASSRTCVQMKDRSLPPCNKHSRRQLFST